MAKKQTTPKRDSKTGRFISQKSKFSGPTAKGESNKLDPSKDKIGTSGTGAKNLKHKK